MLPLSYYIDANVYLEESIYEAEEDEGYIEVCAVVNTPCSRCPSLSGITLLASDGTATGNNVHAIYLVEEAYVSR